LGLVGIRESSTRPPTSAPTPFTPSFTQANPLAGGAAGGNAVASLLMGLPNRGSAPIKFIQQPPQTSLMLSLRFPSLRPPQVPSLDVSLFKAFPFTSG
jgi:hypothetical protein